MTHFIFPSSVERVTLARVSLVTMLLVRLSLLVGLSLVALAHISTFKGSRVWNRRAARAAAVAPRPGLAPTRTVRSSYGLPALPPGKRAGAGPRQLADCMTVSSREESSWVYRSDGRMETCGLYLVSQPDMRIQVTVEQLEVDCSSGLVLVCHVSLITSGAP